MPPSSPLPRRLFIDATYTLCSGKNAGIERVVRSLLRESAKSEAVPSVETVFFHDGQFFSLTSRHIQRLERSAAFQRDVVAQLPPIYRWLATVVCWLLPFLFVRKCFFPDPGHLGLFKMAHSHFEKQTRKSIASQAAEVRFGPGDILLLPDAYWAKMRIWPIVERARQSGAMVASVVYDLIPVTHQEFVGDGMKAKFIEYLRCLSSHSDLIIAISDTVRDQLRNYLPQIDTPGTCCSDIRSFTLGAEFPTVDGEPRQGLRELFGDASNTPYLMVATFEPRKNHTYLLDAFELLWKTNPQLKLCLVGRVGWQCDDLLARLKNHPARNRQLFVFHNVTDSELQFCYRSSRAVILPSIVEGFGLPIVESLWHGKKTFASDTPIHREVGQSDCAYFALENSESLVEVLVGWKNQLQHGVPPLPVRKPIPWAESYQQLMDCCLDAYRVQAASRRMQAA